MIPCNNLQAFQLVILARNILGVLNPGHVSQHAPTWDTENQKDQEQNADVSGFRNARLRLKPCAVLLMRLVRKPVVLPSIRCVHTVYTAIRLGALFAAAPWRLHPGQA